MSFFQKLKDGASKATDKAIQTVEVTRLNSQISSIRKEIAEEKLKMGEGIFQAFSQGDTTFSVADLRDPCERIIKLTTDIEVLELKIIEVKKDKP